MPTPGVRSTAMRKFSSLVSGLMSKFRSSSTFFAMQFWFFSVAKVTDDILIGGGTEETNRFIKALSSVYKLGAIVHMPKTFDLFGLGISQDDTFHVMVNADHKLGELVLCSLPRLRRK